MRRLVLCCVLAACGNDMRSEAMPDAMVDPDPLVIGDSPPKGSLDDLHERIIAKRCSGQPGLCHNGQFEPNLSTPALTYAYLVNRPSIEKPNLLRVKPGSAAESLFIDKLRNRNGVATRMPLGAEPMEEAEIAELEQWIDQGALRAPGATPAPVLNNPPKRPQIGIYNGTTRLDGTGPVTVSANTTLTLRHTVHDFETPDDEIPFAAVLLQIADGRQIVLEPGAQEDPHVGPTTYDPAGPQAQGDVFNFKRTWTIPSTLTLRHPDTGAITTAPAAGQTVTIIAVYIDQPTQNGIVAIEIGATPIRIQ